MLTTFRHYMQSPYLIMIADLWHPEEDEANPDKALSGTICSSLHRLKDVDNKGKDGILIPVVADSSSS